MTARNLVVACLGLVLVGCAYFFVQDYRFRQIHGGVTEVSYFNWEEEVGKVKDQTPVLIYFYAEDKSASGNDEAENKALSTFAWSHAGEVKVVRANVTKPENLVLAIALGAVRYPAYVIIYDNEVIRGTAGSGASSTELDRLFEKLNERATTVGTGS